jgi:delta-aminolevulinic acid dehydratase/porphobilinogen synthase
MRRMRHDAFSRALMREHVLTPADFIYPVFVLEGSNKVEDVKSMPGVQRKTLDLLLADAEQCVKLGIPAEESGCARSVQPERIGAARGRRAENPLSRTRRDDRHRP